MDASVVLVFIVVFLMSLITRSAWKKRKLPPGPFTIPVIGSVGLLRKLPRSRPQAVLYEESRKHGPIYQFSIVNYVFVVLNDYDLIIEALVKNADTCSGRPDVFMNTGYFQKGEDGIIFNQYGDSWRECRRFALQALRDFGVGKTSIEDKILTEVENLTSVLRRDSGKTIAMALPLQKMVSNVAFGFVFGKRWDFDDPEFEGALKLTNDVMKGDGLFRYAMFLPEFLKPYIYKKDTEVKHRIKTENSMRHFIYSQIEEHENTFDKENIRDFVDFYWRSVKHHNELEKKYLTKENMYRIISDLFLAGTETTSAGLDWTFLFMSEFPEVQKKCQEEINKIVGDRVVTWSDRNSLPYVNATLVEIHRMAAIAPLSAPHAVLEDGVTVGGYELPKHCIILPNLYGSYQDPRLYPEPEKFDPNRFIDASGQLANTETVMPFSTGPRVCLGESLARMEMFVVFCNLLQRFTFSRADPLVKHSLKSWIGHITSVPEPYKVVVHIRS